MMQGIWMGMIFGTCLQTLILLMIVWRTNWDEEVTMMLTRKRKAFKLMIVCVFTGGSSIRENAQMEWECIEPTTDISFSITSACPLFFGKN